MAQSNFPFVKDFEAPSATAVTKARFVGLNDNSGTAEITQDLDAAADQVKVIGVVHTGIKANVLDRSFSVLVSPGTRAIMEAGADIKKGDYISADGDGKAIPQANGTRQLGFALNDADDGHYCDVFFA